jgi:tetratricopeptide (TPR) repeat protein
MSPMPPWPTGQRGRAWAIALGIAAAALLAYLPSLSGGFVFDDHALVEGGPLLRGPLWRIWFSTDPVDWWPLTNTALWLEWRLFGDAPLGYRLVNLALHAGVAVLLWRVLERLRVPAAWLAGLLFAVHPVTVESVAWISELKNTLSGVLFLGAILVWLRFRDSGRWGDGRAAALLFACALLAKTSTVILPPILLLLAALERRSPTRREWGWLGGAFGLAVAASAITVWFQWNRSMGGALTGRSLSDRLSGAGHAWWTYLLTVFQPFAAAVVYPDWPPAGASGASTWLPLAAALALGAALVALYLRGARAAPVALAHHAIAVLPVVGLLDMTFFAFSPVGNHLQYLALMGPVALVAGALGAACARWRIPVIACAALALVPGARTFARAAAYRDDVSLWTRAVEEAPESQSAARMLANSLAEAGRPAEAVSALEGAAARIRDTASNLRIRAVLLIGAGRPTEGVQAEAAAFALREDLVFRYEYAVALGQAGYPAVALPLLEDLSRRQPRSAEIRYQLGAALARTARPDLAVTELRIGCELDPASGSCPALAMVLFQLGRGTEARAQLASAMRRAEDDPAVERALRAGAGTPP